MQSSYHSQSPVTAWNNATDSLTDRVITGTQTNLRMLQTA
jgi:hypothetical protein